MPFRQILKRPASKLSTRIGPWRVLFIYSDQYSALSFPAGTHPHGVIWGRPRLRLSTMIWGFFRLSFVGHVLQSVLMNNHECW